MVSIKIFGDEYHDYINDCVPFFALFVILEILVNATLVKKKNYYTVPDTMSSIGTGMSTFVWRRIVTIPILATIEFAFAIYLNKHYALIQVSDDSKLAWIICFLCIDFSYYWFHRLAHEINVFWGTHITHHSSEKYNLSTALRQGVFQPLASFMFFVPYGLFIPPKIFFFHKQFNTIYQFWIHTSLVPKLGFIEYIFNTPSAHRVHHGRNPKYLDKNYGGTLIIFDRIFGTYQEEEEEVFFGIVHPLNSNDPSWSQIHHYYDIYHKFCAQKSWSDKLKVLVYGPGWDPKEPSLRLGDSSKCPIPTKEDQVDREAKPLSIFMNIYLFSHYLLISSLALTLMSAFEDQLGVTVVTNAFIFLYLSLTSFGAFFDRKSYAHLLELSRISLFIICTWKYDNSILITFRFIYYLSFIYIFVTKYSNYILNLLRKLSFKNEKQKVK